MPVRAVLFDLGDTLGRWHGYRPDVVLANYRRAQALLFGRTVLPTPEALMEGVGAQIDRYRDSAGQAQNRLPQPGTAELVGAALAELGISVPADALARFTDAVFDEAGNATIDPPEPEMAAALAVLKSRGLRLASVSNTFATSGALQEALRLRGLAAYLEAVFASSEIGFRKPRPECFAPAMRLVGAHPSEIVFVGDRLDTDIEGANGLGMTAVLTHQYRQEDPASGRVRPDHVIGHLRELPALLDRLSHAEA